jgi:hypothetical protein
MYSLCRLKKRLTGEDFMMLENKPPKWNEQVNPKPKLWAELQSPHPKLWSSDSDWCF